MSARFFFNGQEAEYSESVLPFSLKKVGDEYLSLLPTEAVVSIDNPAKRIVFPGTPKNREIFESAHLPSSRPARALKAMSALIYSKGSQVFAGSGILHGASIGEGAQPSYSVGYRGNVADFYSILSSVKLTELSLGTQTWDVATIEASWTESLDTVKAIWAPVYYGNPDPDNTLLELSPGDLRPSIPFIRIIEAIGELTGYTFESQLFSEEYFKRHVYLYGVKEQAVTDDYVVVATSTVRQTVGYFIFQALDFDNVAEDDDGAYDPSTDTYTAAVTGYYSFSGQTFWESAIADQIPIAELRLVAGTEIYTLPKDSAWSFGPVLLQAGDQVQIEGRCTTTVQTSTATITSGLEFRASLVEATQEGSTVNLASTLHNRPVTDFLDGITHMFNLLWRPDPATKTMRVDPRHGYDLGDGNGFRQGMYKTISEKAPFDLSPHIDQEDAGVRFERPFGDYLIIGPEREKSDLYQKAARLGGISEVPLLCARYNFNSAIGEEGVEELNPFFEGLLLKRTGGQSADMPLVMPDQKDNEEEQLPNYGSNPKYALYAGEQSAMTWHWNGSQKNVRPTLYQRPPNRTKSFQFNGSYTDWYDPVAGTVRQGYASLFYRKWAASIDPAKSFIGRVRFPDHLLANIDFGQLFTFSVPGTGTTDIWMLTRISGFKPEGGQTPEGLFYLYSEPLDGVTPEFTSSAINPSTNP